MSDNKILMTFFYHRLIKIEIRFFDILSCFAIKMQKKKDTARAVSK